MKFIVCYDDKELSADVMREAQKHARVWNAELEIIKVVSRKDPIKRSRLLEMEEELETEVREMFEGVAIPYGVQLDVDDIERGEKIIEMAEILDARLIFMGVKKRSRVGKMLFGSTAQYVLLNAPCPVVTAIVTPTV